MDWSTEGVDGQNLCLEKEMGWWVSTWKPRPRTAVGSLSVVYRRESESEEETRLLGPGKFGTWCIMIILRTKQSHWLTIPGCHKISSSAKAEKSMNGLAPQD